MSTPPTYRTDFTEYALDLIDFVFDRLDETVQSPSSQTSTIKGAACGLTMLSERARQENLGLLAQLKVHQVMPRDIELFAERPDNNFVNKVAEFRTSLESIRDNVLNGNY